MDNQPRRFIDNHKVVIFISDIQIHLFGLDFQTSAAVGEMDCN
jgi:hypothetical protein